MVKCTDRLETASERRCSLSSQCEEKGSELSHMTRSSLATLHVESAQGGLGCPMATGTIRTINPIDTLF